MDGSRVGGEGRGRWRRGIIGEGGGGIRERGDGSEGGRGGGGVDGEGGGDGGMGSRGGR